MTAAMVATEVGAAAELSAAASVAAVLVEEEKEAVAREKEAVARDQVEVVLGGWAAVTKEATTVVAVGHTVGSRRTYHICTSGSKEGG